MKFGRLLLILTALVGAPVLASEPPPGDDQVIKAEGGQLFLRQEVILDTGLAEAWALFTTEEGVTRWMVPVAKVDLRPGGSLRTHYDASAAIGDPGTNEIRIVNYVPERLLTLQADLAPVQADWLTDDIRAAGDQLYNVIEFEALGPSRTRIVSWGIGYRDEESWQPMINFFLRANRWTLGELQKAIQRPDRAVTIPDIATRADDLFAPLRFLVGRCWRGQFGDSPAYDVMCADEMPGGHLRTRHVVRGVDTDYRGETIYHFNGEQQAIAYTYYASSGGVTEGMTELQADGSLLFPDARYLYPDGTFHTVRGRTLQLEDGTFRTESAMLREDGWEEQPILDMRPITCANWAAVEAGCD